MTVFWITAGALLVASAIAMMIALRRGVPDADTAGAADLRVYRDQLAEIERDAARGTIPTEEAARLRVEVSRRILEADKNARISGAGLTQRGTVVAALLILGALAGAVSLYLTIGAPRYPDMPLVARIAEADAARASRQSQAEAEAAFPAPPPATDVDPQFLELMEKLRAATKDRPDDLRGQQLLARNEAQLGNLRAAWAAQEAVIGLKGDQATAADWEFLAQLKIFAAGGYVSPEAEVALTEALRRDPRAEGARYFSGLMLIQTGRPDLAFPLWRDVLQSAAPDSPWVDPIRTDIAALAEVAGVRYEPPAAPMAAGAPGPDAAAMAAAADMTDAERAEMVAGMVGQLDARLTADGGSPEEWARLVSSYAVMGKPEEARGALDRARTALKDQPEAVKIVEAAATDAGITP